MAKSILIKSGDLAGKYKIPIRLVHGDFKPENILLSQEKVVGIDIGGRYRGTILVDIVNFLNHMDLLGCQPRGFRVLTLNRQLTSAFLRGYFDGAPEVPQFPYLWMRIQNLLRLWSGIHRSEQSSLRTWYVSSCIRRRFRGLISEFEAIKS